jgi:hypothetical protein
MLLTIDTNTMIGLFEGEELRDSWRVSTPRSHLPQRKKTCRQLASRHTTNRSESNFWPPSAPKTGHAPLPVRIHRLFGAVISPFGSAWMRVQPVLPFWGQSYRS